MTFCILSRGSHSCFNNTVLRLNNASIAFLKVTTNKPFGGVRLKHETATAVGRVEIVDCPKRAVEGLESGNTLLVCY